jgi:ABC-type enterobactin transport system permease subunit
MSKIEIAGAITGAILAIYLFSGCAAVPVVSRVAGLAGGVTLYKKSTESGPKAEFVLIKFESNHYLTPVTTNGKL